MSSIKRPPSVEEPSRLFFEAAKSGDLEKAKALLKDYNYTELIFEDGSYKPLYYAAFFGNKDMVELLLANGADVNAKNENGFTPLHLVLSEPMGQRQKDVAELLLARNADVNTRNIGGHTPLHDAPTEYVAKFLLANKADINARTNSGRTPLHAAAYKGIKAVVEILLANEAEVNARDNDGKTPLHFAVVCGHKEMAGLLRQFGGHE